jgi:hypothetical protein
VGIAGMVVWTLTAGIGVYLLGVGITAQRAAAGSAAARPATPARAVGAAAATAPTLVDEDPTMVGGAALAVVLGEGGTVRRPAPPEGSSPLLEFTHPALALVGLTFWIFYVMSGDRLFAWIAFGVVVATVLAGLSWELTSRRNRRVADDPAAGDTSFPPHLIMLHGCAAVCTFALVVIAAVVATHG